MKKYYFPKKPNEEKFWKKLAGRARTYWRYYNVARWLVIEQARSKQGKKLQCAKCSKWFKPEDCQVDHIEPIGSLPTTFYEFLVWVLKLNCLSENLQVLDKKCHKRKTNEDRKNR